MVLDFDFTLLFAENYINTAADVLENFQTHWEDCTEDMEKQHLLIKLIVERVCVEDDVVEAITLKSDYHIVLGHKANEPTFMEVDAHIHEWAQRDSNP